MLYRMKWHSDTVYFFSLLYLFPEGYTSQKQHGWLSSWTDNADSSHGGSTHATADKIISLEGNLHEMLD